jgi:hypothetical protein
MKLQASKVSKVAGASSSRSGMREQDAPATAGASSSRSGMREQDAPATVGAPGFRSCMREQDAPATMWEYFNPLTELEIRTGGNLPHWEQEVVWCFVTFRLADALPPIRCRRNESRA